MAVKKKKATKNQFTKGHTKSKGYGRPALTPEQKELRLKTRTDWKNLIDKYMVQSIADLRKLYKSSNLPAIDGMTIKAIINAHESGDSAGINFFLNHALGKPKEVTNIKVTGNVETMKAGEYTKEELLAMKEIHDKKKERENK